MNNEIGLMFIPKGRTIPLKLARAIVRNTGIWFCSHISTSYEQVSECLDEIAVLGDSDAIDRCHCCLNKDCDVRFGFGRRAALLWPNNRAEEMKSKGLDVQQFDLLWLSWDVLLEPFPGTADDARWLATSQGVNMVEAITEHLGVSQGRKVPILYEDICGDSTRSEDTCHPKDGCRVHAYTLL